MKKSVKNAFLDTVSSHFGCIIRQNVREAPCRRTNPTLTVKGRPLHMDTHRATPRLCLYATLILTLLGVILRTACYFFFYDTDPG